MKQCEFALLKTGDYVLTLHKGRVVSVRVVNIYDKGGQCRNVRLKLPNSTATIVRHMYSIYSEPVMEETPSEKEASIIDTDRSLGPALFEFSKKLEDIVWNPR